MCDDCCWWKMFGPLQQLGGTRLDPSSHPNLLTVVSSCQIRSLEVECQEEQLPLITVRGFAGGGAGGVEESFVKIAV